MTIALARGRDLNGARYDLTGKLSRNSTWTQTLELPADGNSVSITGQDVKITFRECEDDSAAVLTVASTASQITVSDADTLTISVTATVMAALTEDEYLVDLSSQTGATVTHWGQGKVGIVSGPVGWS